MELSEGTDKLKVSQHIENVKKLFISQYQNIKREKSKVNLYEPRLMSTKRIYSKYCASFYQFRKDSVDENLSQLKCRCRHLVLDAIDSCEI